MQLRRFALIVAVTVAGASAFAADQSGAEQNKKVVAASIVVPGGAAPKAKSDADPEIGNVQVTYADGTKDLWTTKGNCSHAQVAADGAVGWTVHGAPVRATSSGETMRPNPELAVCRQGKVLARVQAALPFIEDWRFIEGGRQFAFRCRALHGPADIELHDTATGKLISSVKAYDEKLPAWAKPLRDE